jgi:hypothetical protein
LFNLWELAEDMGMIWVAAAAPERKPAKQKAMEKSFKGKANTYIK